MTLEREKKRVLVAMSGGVDSSVAAALLVEAGHEVIGVTMHLWDAQGEQKVGRCCAPEDRDDARRTCEHLGIAHYVFDEREAFRKDVVDPFIAAYSAGVTPSPCVACNQHVKLGGLIGIANALGCDKLATGHYARLEGDPDDPRLLRGVDRDKDQSYFLYGVGQQTLSRMWFPLGALTKDQTRDEGRRLRVPNADKPDSQELCFVPDGDIAGFVGKERGRTRAGTIVDEGGNKIGEHGGVEGFTVGQRKGLGLGGGPVRYVLRIVGDDVVVGAEEKLLASRCEVPAASWLRSGPSTSFDAFVRIRYRHEAARARVTAKEGGFVAEFEVPQRAITKGQAAVVYTGDEVLGGGIIG